MIIAERVSLYKALFKACKALEPIKAFILPDNPIEALEAIRELNTIPVKERGFNGGIEL